MQLPDIRFWAGTEESFGAYIAALKVAAGLDVQAYHDNQADQPDMPRLLTKQGDVGVVSVAGPLVPGEPWYAKYSGVTGYGEIRAALIAAAQDPSIGGIVLDINSGGGAVSGVTDIAELISSIDAGVKPVHTFSDGMIASAAYWLGSSARSVDVGKVTEAGSLGVLTVHKEMSRMLDAMGITATVLRAGEFKALGNPMEPLSDKAKAEIQAQLDQMYQTFLQHVADARGVSYQVADTKMGQGRVFVGTKAVEAGLADSVTNFDAVISKVQGAIDSQKQRSQYGANFQKGPVVKTALTEQQLAAMAEGGLAATAKTPEELAAEAAAKEAADKAAKEAADKAAAEAAAAAAAEAAKAGSQPGEVVALLQSQLAAAQASVVDMTIQLRDTKAAADKATSALASFRAIAEASVDRLSIALNGSAGAAAGLSDEALLAAHANLRTQFEAKFKAGGVAAVSSSGSSDKSGEVVTDEVAARRRQATRPA